MNGSRDADSAAGGGEEGGPPRAAWAAQVDTHRLIRGRRWRVSDPRIPERLRQRLVDELMAARRAVRSAGDADDAAAERAARARVHDAKVALGERGLRWWEPAPPLTDLDDRTVRAARALGARAGQDDLEAVAAVVSRAVDEVAAVLGATGGDGVRRSR